ncbi:glycosyltransferase [Sinirhodobacter populi]|uniref:Glycosyltransferase n=1 Tax=Paenirhodobacter populi TaxID=2306993 RepID=A0A443K4A7_9RHOB|nr:glycosyltransferase [Sinirhodobacter populi]RWR27565.1 glycosyltransferase [Sinirhodobacter populi]
MKNFAETLLSRIKKSENRRQLISAGNFFIPDTSELAAYFDEDFYRKQTGISNGSLDTLISHYIEKGWRENFDPSRNFSTEAYLSINLDVKENNINPLLHYVRYGKSENRRTEKSSKSLDGEEYNKKKNKRQIEKQEEVNFLQDIDIIKPYVDVEFYNEYGYNFKTPEETAAHYLKNGWKEGLNPSRTFSTKFYLSTYEDIEKSGSNPFLHYIIFGRFEGRRVTEGRATPIVLRKDSSITPNHLKSVLFQNITPKLKDASARIKKFNDKEMNIHWVVPDFSKGSGGHMTIFRMIRLLENIGHKNTIWIENPSFHQNAEDAWETIVKYFQCVEAKVKFLTEKDFFEASGDALIATGWSTAYPVSKHNNFKAKFYLVQDHEIEFYPTGAERILALGSYSLKLNCICASPWLEKIMSEKYNLWARSFHLAYDANIYKKNRLLKYHAGKTKRIAVYARSHTARRCVELALMALEVLSKKRDDFEVHFFGQENLSFNETPFQSYNHGILAPEELADLYNYCDIGICFSGTNYSLVPQEMMGCGLPIIELENASTHAIFPNGVVKFAGPHPQDISDTISEFLDDPTSREKQSDVAKSWVSNFTWEASCRNIENAIIEKIYETHKITAPRIAKPNDILLDVVIPTYNGILEVKPVIEMLSKQKIAEHIQVFCVDSSSSDGTAEWLKTQKNVSLTIIDQKEFQHGRTRNFGASLGKSRIIGILTQDATPANVDWATDIVKTFNHDGKIAGMFGKHFPYPHHPDYVKNEINQHFANFLQRPLVVSKFTNEQLWEANDLAWRQFLHYYSDNNSAMRRDVWNEVPYPEVDYGEDQVWARDIIELGFRKAYSPTVCVYHSHDFDPKQSYKRSRIEAEFFYKYFGYRIGDWSQAEVDALIISDVNNFKKWSKSRNIDPMETNRYVNVIRNKYLGLRDGFLAAQGK